MIVFTKGFTLNRKLRADIIDRLNNIVEKPLLTSALVLVIVTLIVFSLSFKYYLKDFDSFWVQILAEAHGMIFDIAIINFIPIRPQSLPDFSILIQPIIQVLNPGASADPHARIALMEKSNIWLGPIQGLVIASIGVLFFLRETDQPSSGMEDRPHANEQVGEL